jgi:hypothetical protein
MTKLLFLPAALLLPLILSILVQSDACRGGKMKNLSINNDDLVITGEWGGEHTGLQINNDIAEVEFDCANGRINQRITLDKNGKFDVTGTYTKEHAGPSRDDQPQLIHSAKYVGLVKDKTMVLTVTLIDTKESIGTFTLVRDSRARVMKCR